MFIRVRGNSWDEGGGGGGLPLPTVINHQRKIDEDHYHLCECWLI